MKAIRILFFIMSLFLLAIFVAVACIIFFIDPNQLKPALIKEVQKQTGYHLAIDGKIAWSFYPLLSIKAPRVTFSMLEASPFMELKDVNLSANLIKLIRQREKLVADIFIEDVKLENVKAQHAHVRLTWRDQKLTIAPIAANLYGGELTGIATGLDFKNVPVWEWDMQINRIQLEPLLYDLNGPTSKITFSGIGDLIFKGTTVGRNRLDAINRMNGVCTFTLNKGVLKGINLNYFVRSAAAMVHKTPIPPSEAINETPFSALSGVALIKDGLMRFNQMQLTAETFTTFAQGNLNLLTQALDLKLAIRAEALLKSQAIPLIISGTLDHPSVRIDLVELSKILTQEQIQQFKNKVEQEIETRIPPKANRLLEKILGH